MARLGWRIRRFVSQGNKSRGGKEITQVRDAAQR
jgi:hypothetical protein